MEKLNIAELLKDCPKGMELYSPLCGKCVFDRISFGTIICTKQNNQDITFTSEGYYMLPVFDNCECMIFPSKENRDWSTFQRPFKDGDILVGKANQPFIFEKLNNSDGCFSYCGIDSGRRFLLASDDWTFANSLRFATEEEKQKLFDAIKANGYKWNPETKTLEKLIVPKFKVGDEIIKRNSISNSWIVSSVSSEYYGLKLPKGSEDIGVLPVSEQDDYELLPNKFDITTLKPFDRVLVRGSDVGCWMAHLFSFYDTNCITIDPYKCISQHNGGYAQCIPYEGNEHLLGTTNDCDEYYKTWE